MRVEPAGPGAQAAAEEAKLRRVVQEFEAIFLAQMLKTMRGRLGQSGLLAMSQGEQLVRELHDEEMGRALARGGGIGLAGMLLAALRGREENPGGNAGSAPAPGAPGGR
ncbi:MAG: rod-binding protein [Armatimonadetes bacterium]|nr:rod-binding protein [Armatimonadota bacterium]